MGIGVLVAVCAAGAVGIVQWWRRKRKLKYLDAFPDAEMLWKDAFPDNEADWRWLIKCAAQDCCGLSEAQAKRIRPDAPWARTMILEWGGDSLESLEFCRAIEEHFGIALPDNPDDSLMKCSFGDLLRFIIEVQKQRVPAG